MSDLSKEQHHRTNAGSNRTLKRPARVARLVAAPVLALSMLGPGCNTNFPSGDLEASLLAALFALQGFGMTPATLTHVAAGATYQFRMTGGGVDARFSSSGCASSIDAGTGLFTAVSEDARCVVTGTSSGLFSRSLSFPVRTYPGLIKSHGSSLYAYLPLDVDATDASGKGRHGAMVPGPISTSGTSGPLNSTIYPGNKYFPLNGTTEFVNGIPGFGPQTVAAGAGMSAEIWFRVTNVNAMVRTTSMPLISQQACAPGTNRMWLGIDAEGQEQITTNLGGTTIRSGVPVDVNRWYHAVVTVKGTALKLYVNGRLRKSAAATVEACTVSAPSGDFNIGYYSTGAVYFQGDVDEAAIYTTELTAEDVAQHYLAGLAKTVGFDDVSTIAAYGNAQGVTAFGGVAPYTYAGGSTLSGDSLDARSGLYTPPTLAPASQVTTTKSFTGTDAHGNIGTHSLSVWAFPISFPTLTAWYTAETLKDRTDLGAAADRKVPVMFDLSPAGMHILATGLLPEFMRPAVAAFPVPGNPAVDFNGFAHLSGPPGYQSLGDATAFALAYVNGNGVLLSFDGPTTASANDDVLFQVGIQGGSIRYAHENNTAVVLAGAGPAVGAGAWHIIGFQRSGGTNITYYLDGTSSAAVTGLGLFAGGGNASRLNVGGTYESIIPLVPATWPGRVAEAVVFYRALSTTEVEQVQCYFKLKYGLVFAIPTYCP